MFGGISHAITNVTTIAAPSLTGYLVAHHGYGSMFIAAGVASGIGMLYMLFVRPGVLGRNKSNSATVQAN